MHECANAIDWTIVATIAGAIGTLVIAYLTYQYVTVSKRMWGEMHEQNRMSSDISRRGDLQFELLNRARLAPVQPQWVIDFSNESIESFGVTLHNSGTTPARITQATISGCDVQGEFLQNATSFHGEVITPEGSYNLRVRTSDFNRQRQGRSIFTLEVQYTSIGLDDTRQLSVVFDEQPGQIFATQTLQWT